MLLRIAARSLASVSFQVLMTPGTSVASNCHPPLPFAESKYCHALLGQATGSNGKGWSPSISLGAFRSLLKKLSHFPPHAWMAVPASSCANCRRSGISVCASLRGSYVSPMADSTAAHA
eukprot:6350336-Prymnesium_polylepis.2